MKIVFLCGSLEPGRDGVGDYTRRLAGEINRQGNQAAIVALMDWYVSEEFRGIQETNGIVLSVLRVPAVWSSKQRLVQVKKWIEDFGPVWLSLQFVPYSFQVNGWLFGLNRQLAELGIGKRWHIMFHELWVGMDNGSSRKQIWWGWLQQYFIQALIARLQPRVIHTQTRLYQAQLAKLGVNASLLPLFSNISPAGTSITCTGLKEEQKTSKKISLVIFGTIHPGAPVELLANEIAGFGFKEAAEITLNFIGRCGSELDHWVVVCESAGLKVMVHGEQPEEFISHVFRHASLGISTTPPALAEKSGAVAAMQQHGLQVLCVSRFWQPRGLINLKAAPGIIEYHPGNFESSLNNKLPFVFKNTVLEVSRQFLGTLLATV